MRIKNNITALIIFIALSATNDCFAECARDYIGNVYCAEQPTGGAIAVNGGLVLCGKGECRKDNAGTVYCSKIPGGGAEKDSIGTVNCLGGCEKGSTSMCVRGER